METILAIVLPIAGTLLAIIVPPLVLWFAAQYQKLTGLELSQKHRDALHSAIETGIGAALNRGLTGKAATAFAISYAVQKGAPDAVAHFTKGNEAVADFQEIAERKLTEAATGVKLTVDNKVDQLTSALNKAIGGK